MKIGKKLKIFTYFAINGICDATMNMYYYTLLTEKFVTFLQCRYML